MNVAKVLLGTFQEIYRSARLGRGIAILQGKMDNQRHGSLAKAAAAVRRDRRNAHRLRTWTGARYERAIS